MSDLFEFILRAAFELIVWILFEFFAKFFFEFLFKTVVVGLFKAVFDGIDRLLNAFISAVWYAATWPDRRAVARVGQGRCSGCGGNLTGNADGICPGCCTPVGASLAGDLSRRFRAPRVPPR